jgi:hypothetical protein
MRRMALFLGAMLAASTALAQQPDRWERFVAAYHLWSTVLRPYLVEH